MIADYEKLGNGAKRVKMIHTERLLGALYKDDYSVVELAKIIGVSHPTTKSIIDQLLSENIVTKSEKTCEKSVGRPHVRYTLNPHHGVFVCINFERYDHSYYIFDFAMNELARRKLKLTNYDLEDLDAIISDIQTDLKLTGLPLLFVSVAMVGQVNEKQEVILSSIFDKHLKHFPFKDYIREKLHCPVALDNDTRIASIGDLKEGDLQGLSNLLYMQIGGGISSVLYNQGEQIVGDYLLPGEVGLTLTDTGKTLHQECTTRALIAQLKDHLREPSTQGLMEAIHTDEVVYETVMNSGVILGRTLRNMSYLTGIRNIAIVGSIAQMPEDYYRKVKEGADIVYAYHPDAEHIYDLNILRSTSLNPVKLGLKYIAKSLYIASLTASM
ncbi:MAG: ROK family transcriptional regulator [Candidatus Izemoplasmatales bacterium]|nr:ROK family transcriptional regulator [Candidatus Izemoplasmatales bacterium]MDD5293190.1 ROK family transcriptional regulator [Candidatus Izemoplasmatales bacterium]